MPLNALYVDVRCYANVLTTIIIIISHDLTKQENWKNTRVSRVGSMNRGIRAGSVCMQTVIWSGDSRMAANGLRAHIVAMRLH